MDLGIAGKRAIVCGSSRGLGRACAEALGAEGVQVTINGRTAATVEQAVEELSDAHGIHARGVVGDVTTAEGRAALLRACPDPDILVTNNAGPEPGAFGDWDRDDWLTALDGNMVSALLLIRAVLDGMTARRFGRIVNITSAMVTSPHPVMGLSSGARAGLTAAVKGLSRTVAPHNVTINNLLPERFDTDRQLFMAQRVMDEEGISYSAARQRQEASIAANRLGRPEEFGATCAFLCSEPAGFISGNNIHLDGGSYVGLI
ncbi:SDR family oxidoreductase [Conexibacter sp. CPCC 206217]|uniref:SDR family oxidoreductase n=1 Tax=Conexibacter sp. CPCC 206217 TaxID=3064574 RepID=UPI00271F51F7|nr:SDR family oxidoreductase [Conexibacter sp. CPCC 206217]MDO8210137.1 SDR family oxidoreductase [Conexibacter sp. CPCC 206217]